MIEFELDFEDGNRPREVPETPLKEWRLKYQAGTIVAQDFIEFFRKEAKNYFEFEYVSEADSTRESLRCSFNEAGAKAGIIDVLLEFILGDNPETILDKLQKEGNTAAVCGKVFKNGEPTYCCRECGMDLTCVLCVNCFKQSPHRYHKYKMSTSGGGGCCDCGDEEAWKKDHYCDEHYRNKGLPAESPIITDAIKGRCDIAFRAIIQFCMNIFEIESIASLECLDDGNEDDRIFCTVLYNDESHTFGQVIQTLTKIVKCRQKDAMDIVASIDREGRAVVRCESFAACRQLKESIEKQSVQIGATTSNSRANQSLRVSVLHRRAVSCQQFAIQLLTWFQEFLMKHMTFRAIFATVISDKTTTYNIGHILEYDVKLWKTARSCWHRLLISGMLMEYDNKMALAQEFSRHYATIVQDFIRDDHDHSFSIVSLSVQLFTVPSIAHYLIAVEGIFHKLLHTFYHESIDMYVQNKTLHFARNMAISGQFKRAAYILYDMRYILSFKPEVWTPELREGFLEGVKVLLRLLNVMQGMESVTRQTGQHMDYEPEWECAFNLHIKLANTISLVLDWCASDREILLKVYQMTMRHLMNNGFNLNTSKIEEQSVNDHVAKCMMYDVSSRPVSIHLPLSRFYAGIYLHLGKYGITFDNAFTTGGRTPEEIMEPILCTQAMIAQVNSGMWRRNGYSLLHQLYFYRNVRCRSEMLDRDIVGLQIGAALIESNQYLIHLLNKFNLLEWIQADYESNNTSAADDDFIRQLSMIDEFLEMLIVIIGERYVPGIANVTDADRIKKEIIQLLCIKSYSHSELNRALLDSNNEIILEHVTDVLADFKKPMKTDSKGVYVLKDEFYDDYNMYFYHYTKEEKSKSEENQRARRKAKELLVCCPPPQLPKLTDGFVSIANLLQCDVMMTIISTVFNRALDLKSSSFTDNHLQKVLHLIGYALQEEASGNYPFLQFFERSQKFDILPSLEKLSHSARVESHRDFILWTLKKFKELQPKESTTEEAMETPADEDEGIEPMTAAEAEKQEKEERSRLAAQRRSKILAQMMNAQRNFMKSNAEMFEKLEGVKDDDESSMDWQTDRDRFELEEGAVAYRSLACLGVDRRHQQPVDKTFKCILCFEDCTVTKDGPCLVYSAYIQKSKVLPPTGDAPNSIYTSSCGHVMHDTCWNEYYSNEESKEMRRPTRNRQGYFLLRNNSDFQCPYCRCVSNAVLPLTAPISKFSVSPVIHTGEEVVPLDKWVDVMTAFTEIVTTVPAPSSPSASTDEDTPKDSDWFMYPNLEEILTGKMVTVDDFKKLCAPQQSLEITKEWASFADRFTESLRKFAHTPFDLNKNEELPKLWHTCSYTIQALEVYLRATSKPFKSEMSIRHSSCLSGLIRASCLRAGNVDAEDLNNILNPVRKILETLFTQKGTPVLQWNCFEMLLSVILSVPSMMFAYDGKKVITCGSFFEFYVLQLLFIANLVKALLLFNEEDQTFMDIDEEEQESKEDEVAACSSASASASASTSASTSQNLSTEVFEDLKNFYQRFNLRQRNNPTQEISQRNIRSLLEHMRTESKQFLRSACLFFHFVTDVEFTDEFLEPDSDTFVNMCSYLGLNTAVESYFDSKRPSAVIAELFASHPELEKYTTTTVLPLVPCTLPVPSLVALPDDYSDLINSVSELTCPNNEREEMKTPTMCLICGDILCGQSYCCQPELEPTRIVGACTYHAHFCGAEIGVFLRIRDCQIVYLGRNKGCFIQPPYLDEYGETDAGLRRGNPLTLCTERYRKIHLLWLGHGLHEEIARLNETTSITSHQWYDM
ncbi:E3 ubiquitin-protein ligase UBR1 isoform X1 [Eupeodes corollae]|uniref:E3 ubiquitin-protein ligase UBR1 isoform X1 n=1 Tax=Eupeodes corollae TaxID=290404 RepID=UPI0024919098|nr:E3 ubiquitin-protein ligase UBR1 isoform X1 [Eupeodes corollae]XP_055915436.1 E3 ubiquitin-protein ligase UBR1 isoform X1 [Eupeodes corollae]XP_055915437.1 E3 ubiquitin-protein ligase UBR1 isoform X1 [Eupeodes corollae]XP_055915438.1 E3 ubiquitin-protein ligase UBR1 isoform X1 [Eupeodes corollae]XP_055915439.1 E3 ubiquitin-protein ligase UBR1 isoform X1 [Eupeodes corollae]XP_055915440.1 E3 ubiquitin-protein ligase UBR1 isoform X1 [Eupeodes corollae]